MNRRYKVFLSDLEKALIYALSHEVAQHATIAGQPQQHLLPFALSPSIPPRTSYSSPPSFLSSAFSMFLSPFFFYFPFFSSLSLGMSSFTFSLFFSVTRWPSTPPLQVNLSNTCFLLLYTLLSPPHTSFSSPPSFLRSAFSMFFCHFLLFPIFLFPLPGSSLFPLFTYFLLLALI
jgi:hypothetical protein